MSSRHLKLGISQYIFRWPILGKFFEKVSFSFGLFQIMMTVWTSLMTVWKPEIFEQSGTVNLFDPDLYQVVWFASLLKLRHSSLNSFSKDWWVTIFTIKIFPEEFLQGTFMVEAYDSHRMTHFWNILLFKRGPSHGLPGSLRVDDTILCPKCLLLNIHREAEFRTIYFDVTLKCNFMLRAKLPSAVLSTWKFYLPSSQH